MRTQSRAAGMLEGEVKGQMKVLVSLLQKNRLTLQEAADEASMTVDEFVKKTGIKTLVN